MNGFNDSMSQIGKSIYQVRSGLYDSEETAEAYSKIWKNVAKNILDTIGPSMTRAGFDLISYGAINDSKSAILSGIGLVAAGGVSSILGGALGAGLEDDSTKDDGSSKLQSLKDLLADIIEQAKIDAEYYEKHYLHQKALSANREISVNDAIITPNGNVISTHPDDYLIATKTPENLSRNSTPMLFLSLLTRVQVQMFSLNQQKRVLMQTETSKSELWLLLL